MRMSHWLIGIAAPGFPRPGVRAGKCIDSTAVSHRAFSVRRHRMFRDTAGVGNGERVRQEFACSGRASGKMSPSGSRVRGTDRRSGAMKFETVATGGCRSYLIGCEQSCAAALIDPELSQIDRYIALAARDGLRIRYLVDTHTHADHFSATQQLARRFAVPAVMHSPTPAPLLNLPLRSGELLLVGRLRLQALHTPGHTRDSMCLCVEDRVFTGDTLLIGGTGRTDLPSGDAGTLYESLFEGVLKLDPSLKVFPAHEYKGRSHSTIGQELAENPRLQKGDRGAFIEMMQTLNLTMPTHITEALRTSMTGRKTMAQILSEAAAIVQFMACGELKRCLW